LLNIARQTVYSNAVEPLEIASCAVTMPTAAPAGV
jgi:hypothetical protein